MSRTSVVKFTVISGAYDERPLCYMLQVDEFRFLLDCGWDAFCDPTTLGKLSQYATQVDAVLLCYPDIAHVGALAYAWAKLGLRCPIYATLPVKQMGQIFLYDLQLSRSRDEANFSDELFSLDDIDAVMDNVHALKHTQKLSLTGKGLGITVVPFAAGHMVGGTLWKIVKDTEEIIYAVDYNHKKERILDGAVLESLSRPTLLITDSLNAMYSPASRRERDKGLLEVLLSTLRGGGNVLIPVDSAGRVLELLMLLEAEWGRNKLTAYPLVFLNTMAGSVIDHARAQLEYMSERLTTTFQLTRDNPFFFKHIISAHTLQEVEEMPSPKVVLCSQDGMNTGFSLDLFAEWSSNNVNTVVFPGRALPGTLARSLIDDPSQKRRIIKRKRRVILEGDELRDYMLAREARDAEEVAGSGNRGEEGDDDDDDDDDDIKIKVKKEDDMDIDDEDGDGDGDDDYSNDDTAVMDIYEEGRREMKQRGGSFFKRARTFAMFPARRERVHRWDDYGEIIRPEDYRISEDGTVSARAERAAVALGKGSLMGTAGGEGKGTNEAASSNTTAAIAEAALAKTPTKTITEDVELEINCRLVFIDFEGRSDARSIQTILSHVAPRQVIIVHGGEAATEHLAEHCQTSSNMTMCARVSSPRVGECVDVTSETNVFQVKLKDSLVTSLSMSRVGDVELAFIDGRITGVGEDVTATPMLEHMPTVDVEGHPAVFVGDIKLSDFKHAVLGAGLSAEFAGGALICNGKVAVRRLASGRVAVEGSMCRDYFVVRDLLYSQFAIL